jgi:hypothetical protein
VVLLKNAKGTRKSQKSKVKGQKSKISRLLRTFDCASGATKQPRIKTSGAAAIPITFDF